MTAPGAAGLAGTPGRLCMCGKPESDSVHWRPQTSELEHRYEVVPTEAEFYGPTAPGTPDVERRLGEVLDRADRSPIRAERRAIVALLAPVVDAIKREAQTEALEAAAEAVGAIQAPRAGGSTRSGIADAWSLLIERAAALRAGGGQP